MPAIDSAGIAPMRWEPVALLGTGHVVYPGPEMIREVLDWFDRYLGPVTLKTAGSP